MLLLWVSCNQIQTGRRVSAGSCVCSQTIHLYAPGSHLPSCKVDLHFVCVCVKLLGQRTVGMSQLKTEHGYVSCPLQ